MAQRYKFSIESKSFPLDISCEPKSPFRDTECAFRTLERPFRITEWRFRITERKLL